MGEKGLGLGKNNLGDAREMLGTSKELKQPEEFAAGSLSWNTAARAVTDGLADSWFEDYKPAPASKVLPKNAFFNQDAAKDLVAYSFFGEEETKLLPDLTVTPESLGELISLEESALGRTLIEVLNKNGISWFYKTRYAIDHFRNIELEEAKDEGLAHWPTYFDMPIVQSFRVYRDSKGKETIYWSAPMLVSTREFTGMRHFSFGGIDYSISDEEVSKGTLPYGEWSTKLFIPAFFKRLFFLSETPFPSQIFSMSREIAFKDVPKSSLPKPAIMHWKKHFVQGAYSKNAEGIQLSGTIMPDVIEAGWLFSTDVPEELETILGVVSNGLIKFATYLEDGYLNFKTIDYPYPFDNGLLSGAIFDERFIPGVSALGRSQWIPAVRIGILLNETNELTENFYANPRHDSPEFRSQAELIVFDGAGAYVPSMTNTLTYSWLLKEQNWDLIDQVQEAAVALAVENETANALSNWGIAKYLQGKTDEALELFSKALEDSENRAEDEATFYLAKIFAERGELAKAEEFKQRCINAGGYETFDGSERLVGLTQGGPKPPQLNVDEPQPPTPAPSVGLPKKSGGGLGLGTPVDTPTTGQAKFCSSCGSAFGSPNEKFCGQCGAKRE